MRAALIALVIGSALAVGGCGSSTRAGGDPGNKRLHALRSDAVFASAPPGARAVETRESKARYRKPGFDAGGWDGPSVVVSFRSSAPPADVFGYYARRAEAAGWKETAKGALDLADRWAKTFPGNAPATLLLTRLGEARYQVSGSIALAG